MRKYWVLVFSVLLMSCATSPLGRKQLTLLPASQVDAMGVESFATMKKETPVNQDPRVNAYVQCVTNAITRISGGQWEVAVFDDDSANAFALPGGKIGVHTGLLKVATSQHQLAAVIGHEIAHVQASHGNERVSQQFATQIGLELITAVAQPNSEMGQLIMAGLGLGAQFGILLPFSRIQESEADMMGLDLMAKAGFNPSDSITLWENMSKAGGGGDLEFLSTHPSHSTRISDLNQRMNYAQGFYQDSPYKPNCQ